MDLTQEDLDDLLEMAFDAAVKARQEHGISMERTCSFMVLSINGVGVPGKFALDKTVPGVVRDVKEWLHGLGFDDQAEVEFQAEFVPALVNPGQDSRVIKAEEAAISVRCVGFGDGKTFVTVGDLREEIKSILSEEEDPGIAIIEAKFLGTKQELG